MADAAQAHLSHFNLKINGRQAGKDVMNQILDCTVDNTIHLPDVCTLRLHDAGFHWLDQDTFSPGVEIEVFGGDEGAGELKPIFHGEVTALEMDLAAHGVPTLSVRGYDRSHRLQRGHHNRSFVQMTDTDIVRKIGDEMGFQVTADHTPQVHDWVFQNNQTNWEFLTERAARNGFRLYLEGKTRLRFRKVKDGGEGTVALEWGKNLRSFRPRLAAAPQVSEVIVRGWDPRQKQTLIGRAAAPHGLPQVAGDVRGGRIAERAFGAAKRIVVDRPVHSQAEADDVARSLCDDIGGQYLEAEGLGYGAPTLKPGMMVEIENIGDRFKGKYFVTSTTHTYSPSEGYTTLFSVNGKRPSTLLSLLEEEGGGRRAPLGNNIVIGLVTDNTDPDGLARVKVKYPHLTEDHASHWVRLSAPMAGPGRGIEYLPEVDDEVLVAFEHGDIRRPYILGALWNGRDKPPLPNSEAVQGGKVVRRITKTRTGHQMDFDDGAGKIKVVTAGNHCLEMSDTREDVEVRITTKGGHTVTAADDHGGISAIQLRTSSQHTVTLADNHKGRCGIFIQDKAGNEIFIDSADNSITISCAGDLSIEAGGKVSIKGMQVDVEAKTTGSFKAAAEMEITGALVKIN